MTWAQLRRQIWAIAGYLRPHGPTSNALSSYPSAAIFVLDVEATGAVSSYRRAETFLLAIIIAVFVSEDCGQACDAAVEDEPAPQRNPVSAECGVTSSVLAAARSRGAAPRRCGRSAP